MRRVTHRRGNPAGRPLPRFQTGRPSGSPLRFQYAFLTPRVLAIEHERVPRITFIRGFATARRSSKTMSEVSTWRWVRVQFRRKQRHIWNRRRRAQLERSRRKCHCRGLPSAWLSKWICENRASRNAPPKVSRASRFRQVSRRRSSPRSCAHFCTTRWRSALCEFPQRKVSRRLEYQQADSRLAEACRMQRGETIRRRFAKLVAPPPIRPDRGRVRRVNNVGRAFQIVDVNVQRAERPIRIVGAVDDQFRHRQAVAIRPRIDHRAKLLAARRRQLRLQTAISVFLNLRRIFAPRFPVGAAFVSPDSSCHTPSARYR